MVVVCMASIRGQNVALVYIASSVNKTSTYGSAGTNNVYIVIY